MTILITHINRHGIVHGTDSHITYPDGSLYSSKTKKLYEIPYLNAAVSVAGNWLINGSNASQEMHEWMADFIDSQKSVDRISLRLFAKNLAAAWKGSIPAEFRRYLNWAHISGFVQHQNESHIQFWAVTNERPHIPGRPDVDFDYVHHWEDFSTRDCRKDRNSGFKTDIDIYREFENGAVSCVQYMNGTPQAKIAANNLLRLRFQQRLIGPIVYDFVQRLPAISGEARTPIPDLDQQVLQLHSLSQPRDLEETEQLVRTSIEVIARLFELEGRSEVGGSPYVLGIPMPGNVVKTCNAAPIFSPAVIDNDTNPEWPSG